MSSESRGEAAGAKDLSHPRMERNHLNQLSDAYSVSANKPDASDKLVPELER